MENQMNVGKQNTQQIWQNPVSQPLPTIEKPKTNYLMIGEIILASFVVFGFGGYYLGKQSLNSQQTINYQQASPTPTNPLTQSSPTPTTMIDSTADWELYSGKEYSFRHPTGLKSDTGAAGVGFESIQFQYMGPKQIASGRTQTSLFDGYSFVVTKIGSASQKTSTQWANERRDNSKENCGPEVVLSEIKQITIDKGAGVQYSVKNCIGDYTSSYVTYNGNVYEITQLYVGEEADQKNYQDITDQIFNSLKFF